MIGKPVLHSAHMPVIIIKHARIALAGSAVMHHDELPAWVAPISSDPIDFITHRPREISITSATAAAAAAAEESRPKTSRFFVTRLLDGDFRRLFNGRLHW